MNFINNQVSFGHDKTIRCTESIRLSISAVWDDCFMQFNELLANRFFCSKIWIKFIKHWVKSFTCQTPANLISMFGIFMVAFDMRNTSSKSFHEPKKYYWASIVAPERNFVGFVWSVARFICRNAKTTFGINESCKIRIIKIIFDTNKRNSFDIFNNIAINSPNFISVTTHFMNKLLFDRLRRLGNVIDKNRDVSAFIDYKIFNFLGKFQSRATSNYPMETLFPMITFCVNWINAASKLKLKKLENGCISRGYYQLTPIFDWTGYFVYKKTTISINIPSCVR